MVTTSNIPQNDRLRILTELSLIEEETRKWHASRSSKAIHIYSRTKVIRAILERIEPVEPALIQRVKRLFNH